MDTELSLKELCEGLFDLLDGIYDASEINYNTGIPLERCEELLVLKQKCYKYINPHDTELRSVV
jgi:hypothetical protein